jgi:hypothetical protein
VTTPSNDEGFEEFLAQMEHLQNQLADAEAEVSASAVEGSAGGGKVRIRASGEFEFESVDIDPSVLDPANADLVEDLVLAAIRDAANKLGVARKAALDDVMRDALGGLMGGQSPLGGLPHGAPENNDLTN